MAKILFLGAHFDDIELGCGGTVARHVEMGDAVSWYIATDSGYTDHKGQVVRDSNVAKHEGSVSGALLGVEDILCGDFPTNQLQNSEEFIIDILNVISDLEIDTIYTHWIGDVHHDHACVARATLTAARHISRLLMYRSNWYESPMPFYGKYFVDISKYIEKKKAAIRAHKSECTRVGDKWTTFVERQNAQDGNRIGVEYAECFEIVKFLS
jgi:LmbE family N-acetylglucosaminyl deacetylase